MKRIALGALCALLLGTPARAQEAKLGEVVLFGEENVKIQSATKTESSWTPSGVASVRGSRRSR